MKLVLLEYLAILVPQDLLDKEVSTLRTFLNTLVMNINDRQTAVAMLRHTHIWRLYYRQDAAKRQTAGIKFTHRPKMNIFTPQGRFVAPIHMKLGVADGHMSPLGCAKFHLNRCRGWESGPQNIKNFHFLVKSRPAGATPLTDFENF